MSVLSRNSGNVVIVTPQDRFDTDSAPEVEKILADHIERGSRRVVLDLSHIAYISSMGLRVILKTAMELARKDGKLGLCGGNEQVVQVLRLSGAMVMGLHVGTLEEAIRRIEA